MAKDHPGSPPHPMRGRNKAYAIYDTLARDSMEDAIKAIGERAKNGDTNAAKLLFARVWPRARDEGEVIELDLPPLEKPADLITAYSALIEAVGSGEIVPEQAAHVGGLLERKRLAIETASHEPRLTALEDKYRLKPAG